MKYYSAKEVTKILGVTAQTLRNWDKQNKLKPSYTKSNGYRYYSEESILSYTQERKTKKDINVIGYARVSSKKQEDDLNRQIDNLNKYISNKYTSFEIISDIGSGINYSKPGLLKLIDKINRKEIVDKICEALEDAEAEMTKTKMFLDMMRHAMPSKAPAQLKHDGCTCGGNCDCKKPVPEKVIETPEARVEVHKILVRKDIDVDTVIGEFLKSLSE